MIAKTLKPRLEVVTTLKYDFPEPLQSTIACAVPCLIKRALELVCTVVAQMDAPYGVALNFKRYYH